MNELDALRQEAETLKNAIRVSTQKKLIKPFIGFNQSKSSFRMHEKQHATPASCRQRITWNQSDAFRCAPDAHSAVT
jgi:hypothetical protein